MLTVQDLRCSYGHGIPGTAGRFAAALFAAFEMRVFCRRLIACWAT